MPGNGEDVVFAARVDLLVDFDGLVKALLADVALSDVRLMVAILLVCMAEDLPRDRRRQRRF
jgi:hypothetical protein